MNKDENVTNIPDIGDLDGIIKGMEGLINLPPIDDIVEEYCALLEKKIEAGEVKLKKDLKRAKKLYTNIRERRKYTMSQLAIDQRRVAAKRPKKKRISANNWKHGQYAKTPVTVLKPCLSSCVKYPCDKVQDFTTKAGDLCFSDDSMFRFYTVLVKAVHKKETEGFYDAAAYLIGNSMAILDKLMEEVLNNGTTISREKFNTMGDVVGQDMISHPNLLNIGKLLQSLNLNLSEFLLTPLSRAKIDQGKEGISTIAELLSNIGQKLSLPKRTLMESHQGDQ